MIQLKGCGTALVTPFTDGEVDYEAYAALIDRQVDAGVDFLVPLATTGETPTLSDEEKVALLKLTYGHAAGKTLLVGCGSNSVRATLANMELLDSCGADAWLVVVPFYNKPTQEGQYQYFKTIAGNTDKPIIIYNVPGRTGANMSAQTCIRLAKDVPNIVGIKEASGKIEQVKEILSGVPEDFSVLSGDDDLTLEMMKYGAKGVISVASNIVPAEITEMTHSMSAEIDARLHNLFKNCFVESNPIPVKAGMSLLGLMSSEVRLPLSNATPGTVEVMKKTLEDLGLL